MLSGKTALVTGASSGIGEAIARKLGSEGADVVLAYYEPNESGGEHTRRITATLDHVEDAGSSGTIVEGDLSDSDAVSRVVETGRESFGGIDVLVNNAGIFPRVPWDQLTYDVWERTLAVNVGGLAMLSRDIVPEMAARGAGSVVNMSSLWAIRGSPESAAYTASKGAIASLTRQMCREFGPDGVRVNAVLPGAIETPLNEAQRENEEYVDAVESGTPAGRFGKPGEVAELVAFLASSKASYINGECVTIDGGLATTVQ